MKKLSFIIRFAICYITIETIPIVDNEFWAATLIQAVPVYSIMMVIAYAIVGGVFKYKRGQNPSYGAFLYFIVYIPLILLLWGTLIVLTSLDVIPIG